MRAVLVLADVDATSSGSICRRRGIDDVQDTLVVQRQIVRETTLFLPGEASTQIVTGQQRSVRIARILGSARKAPVVVLTELVEVRIASVLVADAAQSQLLHQSILKRLVRALDAALGRRRVRTITSMLRSRIARPNCV